MNESRFEVMYVNGWAGIVERKNDFVRYVVEPEYNSKVAEAMCQAMNENPNLDPCELSEIAERTKR